MNYLVEGTRSEERLTKEVERLGDGASEMETLIMENKKKAMTHITLISTTFIFVLDYGEHQEGREIVNGRKNPNPP